jgi:translation initiation factor 1
MGLFDGTPLQRPVTCEACGKPLDACTCPRDATGAICRPTDQPVRVRREKRRGKWMTVVYNLDPAATDLKAMLKQFKAKCAAGGSVTPDGIEIQGDHRDMLVEVLRAAGYPAKAAGG